MLMSRSFRCYQGGEMVQYGQMTMKDVKDYLILKAQMVEEDYEEESPDNVTFDIEELGSYKMLTLEESIKF